MTTSDLQGGDVSDYEQRVVLMNVPSSCDSGSAQAYNEILQLSARTSIDEVSTRRSIDVLPPLPGVSEDGFDFNIAVDNVPTLRKSISGKSESSQLQKCGSGKHVNKVLTRLPSDHWRDDGDAFRNDEEKKRTENLQQAVMDFNNNGWTHTRLFFSHCW